MNAFRTRVRAVRFKDGRELRVLRSPDPLPEVESALLRHARDMVDGRMAPLAGFALVCWDAQGFHNRSWRVSKNSFLGDTLMPAYVADVLRKAIGPEDE